MDTAGRLSIDAELMEEVRRISDVTQPHYTFLVVDAMTGQDAVTVAENFHQTLALDGVILTKLDGDARGGAALSVKQITGKPILYASTGEKLDAFERFHPDRMAQRILGMGDVMTLIEKAEQRIDEKQAQDLERKIKKNQFTLDDFLAQMQQLKKMGPLSGLVGMIPGMPKELKGAQIEDEQIARVEAIIRSMTPGERANPKLIDGSRRSRIAKGSGVTVADVNQLVDRFFDARKMMEQVARGGGMGLPGSPGMALGKRAKARQAPQQKKGKGKDILINIPRIVSISL